MTDAQIHSCHVILSSKQLTVGTVSQADFLWSSVLIRAVAKIKLNMPTCGGTLIHVMFFKSLPAEFGQLEPYRSEAQMWAICLSCHLVSFHHDLATLMKATNMQSTCLWNDICLLSQGNHTLLPKFPTSLSLSEDAQLHSNGKCFKHLQTDVWRTLKHDYFPLNWTLEGTS